MKITHYLYNAFLIESGDKKIAIDPGALMLYYFRLTSLIPESQWNGITHVFVTHGDPDHYWHADRVAAAANAPVICNRTMVRNVQGKTLALGPRAKGLAFTTEFQNLHTLGVGETIALDGVSVTGIQAAHGDLTLKLGPISRTFKPGPDERIGWGAIGFEIVVDGLTVVNLGDTLLHEAEWSAIQNPDVLMIPIGGSTYHNTMDEREALQAVKAMRPELVIPCHYNCPVFFDKSYNPADEGFFKAQVEQLGSRCAILRSGDSIDVAAPTADVQSRDHQQREALSVP